MELLKKKINKSLFNIYFENEIYNDIFLGGKKIRPILSFLIFKQFSQKNNFNYNESEILNLCLTSEILHNISLILDDMPCMDNDNYRRCKETIHYKYGCHSALAIIFDILNKYSQILKNYIKEEEFIFIEGQKFSLLEYLTNIINSNCLDLIEGQYLDLNYIPIGLNESKIIKVNSFKTVPLFRISFLIGYFLLYKCDKNYNFQNIVIKDLGEIAKSFGLIFQISDDYLDIEQDKKNKIFLNFFLTLGKKRALELYKEHLDNINILLKKHNLDCKYIKEILTLIHNRIYD